MTTIKKYYKHLGVVIMAAVFIASICGFSFAGEGAVIPQVYNIDDFEDLISVSNYPMYYPTGGIGSDVIDSSNPDNRARELTWDSALLDQWWYSGTWDGMDENTVLDATYYSHLVFRVKGAVGGEDFKVELQDRDGNVTQGDATYFVENLTTDWQEVRIPVSYFAGNGTPQDPGIDLTKVKAVVFTFSDTPTSPSGTIYIDDMKFEGCMVDNFNDYRSGENMLMLSTGAGGTGLIENLDVADGADKVHKIRWDYPGTEGLPYWYTATNFSSPYAGFNPLHYNYLYFRIKGSLGGEKFLINYHTPSTFVNVNVADYVTVTTDWQDVYIPLKAFTDKGVTRNELNTIAFRFADPGNTQAGTIYVDDAELKYVRHTPIITTGDKTFYKNCIREFHIEAYDPDGDPLVYDATDLPTGATIDKKAGLICWRPTSTGTHAINLIVREDRKYCGELGVPTATKTITIIVEDYAGFVKPPSTGAVKLQERQLVVNGAPFKIKGIGYQPIPIGQTPDPAESWYHNSAIFNRDFDLLNTMGVNTIRTWGEPSEELLAAAADHGLKVCAGYWVDYYVDVTDPAVRTSIKEGFHAYVDRLKDHSAILIWAIGNENNAHPLQNKKEWYSLVNEMAADAYNLETTYHGAINYHPVAVVNGNMENIGNMDMNADDISLAYVDIWGCNIFPGYSFCETFNIFASLSDKPMWISEYGIDAYHTTAWHANGSGYVVDAGEVNEDEQAAWDGNATTEILASDIAIGGTLMSYSDEWWKMDENSVHNTGGFPQNPEYEITLLPDEFMNEEYWGIVEIAPDGTWSAADGLDDIKTRRAYDTLRNIFLPESKPPSTGAVKVSGRKIFVNGQPFTIKGVGYQPTPVGYDVNQYSIFADPNIYNRDFTLLRDMNCNTIRTWAKVGYSDGSSFLPAIGFMDAAHNGGVNPVYVIMGFPVDCSLNLADSDVRQNIINEFKAYVNLYKNHPAVLMWAVGNENNNWYQGDVKDWYTLVNDLARAAYEVEGAPYHPVTVINGDIWSATGPVGNSAFKTDDASMTFLDVWGANVYSGWSFQGRLQNYEELSSKPFWISEYGFPGTDERNQAVGAAVLWNEIEHNPDTCSGGTIMEYSDEWWKSGYPASHEDSYGVEFFGMVASEQNDIGVDTMHPRPAYFALQEAWSTGAVNNIAFGKDVYVSSEQGGAAYAGVNVVDGDPETRWASIDTDPQWICVDLGEVHSIGSIVLWWEIAYGSAYEIQISDDAVTWTTAYSTSSGDGYSDFIYFDTTPISGRYVRMHGTQRGTPWGYSLWEFEIYEARPVNVAKGKPAVALSVEGPDNPVYAATCAVDGDFKTRWASDYSDPQWIYVDLGINYDISEVVLRWETAYGRMYKIQKSQDGVNWFDVDMITASNGTDDYIDFGTSFVARYVRLFCMERGTSYGCSLWEFEVYGVPTTYVPPVPPAADFSASPTVGEYPLAVAFTNASTGVITSYSWTFGDGATSAEENPSHTYMQLGKFPVSLTVVGPGGSDTETKTDYITVSDTTAPAITIDPVPSPTNGDVILIYHVSDNYSSVEHITVTGDESPYITEGLHEVTLRATDESGNFKEASISFTIDKTAPVIKITSPQNNSGATGTTIDVSGTIDDPTATIEIGVTGQNTNYFTAVNNGNGTFSCNGVTIEGSGQRNVVVAIATDTATNPSSDAISIFQGWVMHIILPNYYQKEVLSPTYTFSSSGAATSRMILDLMRPGTNTPTQLEIYNYGHARNLKPIQEMDARAVDAVLGHFDTYDPSDPYGDGSGYYGYNFTIDTYTTFNNYIRDIAHWMSYPVTKGSWWNYKTPADLVESPNTPPAVPAYGSYDHWVAVNGAACDKYPFTYEPHASPWSLTNFVVYGLWFTDPAVGGIGQDSYVIATECQNTILLPLSSTDSYNGKYLQVAEPPPAESNAEATLAEPIVNASTNELLKIANYLSGDTDPLKKHLLDRALVVNIAAEKDLIACDIDKDLENLFKPGSEATTDINWKEIIDPSLISDKEFANSIQNSIARTFIPVKRLDKENNDYYIIPFDKFSKGQFLSYAAIIIDKTDGHFKQASWVDEPVRFIQITKDEAIKKAAAQLNIENPENVQAELVWTSKLSDSPFYPVWMVTINENTCYINQQGEVK